MNFFDVLPYLVAVISSILSWIGSYIMSSKKSKSDIESLKIQNEHSIEMLISQHKVDIEDLEKKHQLELDKLKMEHQFNMELIQKEHENELLKNDKELENNVKIGASKEIFSTLFNNALAPAMNNPEIQKRLVQQLKEGLDKPKK